MVEAKEKTYTVHDVKGQLKVTVPKVLAQAVGIVKGIRSNGSLTEGSW